MRSDAGRSVFQVRIVSPGGKPFECGHRIPVRPDFAVEDDPTGDIVIVPELWLGLDEDLRGRHPELLAWIRRRYEGGAWLYSACSGSVMLAATGLLDGCEATSHFADLRGRIVTAGGTNSWHDLALHVIGRHASSGEALRIAKVQLLKLHGEGQLPYRALVRGHPTGDAVRSSAASRPPPAPP